MKLRLSIFSIFFLLNFLSQASTMYTLSDINKVYPVIEIMTKVVPQKYKAMILEEMIQTMDELNIQYSGYDQRSIAVLVSSISVKEDFVITVELLIGEEVRRLETMNKTFALTYTNKSSFIFSSGDDLEDLLDDSLTILLHKFSQQFEEESKALVKLKVDEENFAQVMHYETSFDIAVKKAKKFKKDIMLVIITNYCPWCRKFEQRVLMKKAVNNLVHKNYIPLILNKNKDKFPKEFIRPFSPVVHFIDFETLKSYESVVGYNNREEFLHLIKKEK